MTQQLSEDQIRSRVRERLVDGSMTQDQARQVLDAWKSQQAPAPQQAAQTEVSYMQALTGNAPSTPETEMQAQAMGGGAMQALTAKNETGLDIVFNAPELREISWRGFKSRLGGLLEGNPQELAEIIGSNYPEAQFSDLDGNLAVDLPSGRYLLNPPGIQAQDILRFSGDVAAFAPAGRVAGMGARQLGKGAVRAMGTQAAIEGAEQAVGGEFDAGDVALAGGLQAGGQALGAGASAIGRAVKGQADDATREVIEAGAQFDVPVMTTDVIPPRTGGGRAAQVMAENVPIAGTGGPRQAQQMARERAANEFVDRFQGGSYETIIQSMKDKRTRFMQAAGRTYDSVIPRLNQASQEGIPFSNTSEAIERARETLNAPGRVTSSRALDLLDEIQETTMGPGQNFQTVKDNIGAWSEAIDSIDPAIRSQLSSNDRRLVNNVIRAMRQDRDDFARDVLSAQDYRRLKSADAAYGEAAQNLRETRIKNVFDKGDATPEVARNLLFSNKPSEVRNMYQSLTTEGRENARAVIIGDIVSRLNRRAGGMTPDSLATELGRSRETLDVFFRGERRRELNGLMRLLDATRRAQRSGASFTAPTGERLIPYVVGAGAVIEPATAAAFGTVGGLGRLYESPRVRTVLARMASTDPESQAFQQLIEQYQTAVQSVAQGLRESE